MFNITRRIIEELVSWDEDARTKFNEAMEWPEEHAQKQAEAMDRQARQSTMAIGGRSFEDMLMSQLAARARSRLEKQEALERELLRTSPTEWVAEAEARFDEEHA